MMISMVEYSTTRSELMASFQILQAQFDQQKNNIETKEQSFNQLRQRFASVLQERSERLAQMIHTDNPMHVLARDLSGQLDSIFALWEAQALVRAKGARFRQGFGDSLLVFIYGKVKSGKSSLGNYMAWGHSEPTLEIKAQSVAPVYFSTEQTNVTGGDQDKEAENAQQFRVGATEATSSIQGFTRPGLTWVDSPGLHSVNARNGDLAKEYVEHADLILYTMHSQAPGRASDLEEIAALLNSEKKVLILLTGSDTTEEDEDADGNLITLTVMKDLSDQRDQIAYVQGELQTLKNASSVLADVLPVSTRYAQVNPTPETIAESGMGRLMYELQKICTGPALSMKLNTPMANLRSAISLTASDLIGARETIDAFANGSRRQHEFLQRELSALGVLGSSEMKTYINQVFSNGHTDNLEASLHLKLSEIIEQLSLEATGKVGEKQQKGFQQALNTSRLGKLPEYRQLTEEKEYFIGTRKGNKSLIGLGGAVVGGIAGFFIGGPAGALLGASLGSSASMAGRSASAQYGRHQVVVGDNREEQRRAAIEHYANRLPALLTEHVNSLYEPLQAAMQEYCHHLNSDITQLQHTLEQLTQADQ